jgi:hypothetical protein
MCDPNGLGVACCSQSCCSPIGGGVTACAAPPPCL